MIEIKQIALPVNHQDQDLLQAAARRLGIQQTRIVRWRIKRRSLDARKGRPLRKVYTLLVEVDDPDNLKEIIRRDSRLSEVDEPEYRPAVLKSPGSKDRPVIVGTGPAGMFAGLVLAEAGLNPVLLERGKEVQQRIRDVNRLWDSGVLNPESNVQFGEGGAGTFSDGKLTTRVKDRHLRGKKVLREFVKAGAPEEILYDYRPHIGTDFLVGVVKQIRQKIQRLGGEYLFNTRMDDLAVRDGAVRAVRCASGEEYETSTVILALGHSARDTFNMLVSRGVNLVGKPLSMGVRIEHPQALINQVQLGSAEDIPGMGPASYQVSYRTSTGRTVYSFCMCPGGSVICAASEAGSLVTNGMSNYRRDGVNANSALVAEISPQDFGKGPLDGMKFQRLWERKAYELGGGKFIAPAQRVGDFLSGSSPGSLGQVEPTYAPGVRLVDLRQALPGVVADALLEALPALDRKIPGFLSSDAVLTGVETRTSSPVRILRGKDLQSDTVQGLYPVGEGSGYAGGIMSSAKDGIRAAEMIIRNW